MCLEYGRALVVGLEPGSDKIALLIRFLLGFVGLHEGGQWVSGAGLENSDLFGSSQETFVSLGLKP